VAASTTSAGPKLCSTGGSLGYTSREQDGASVVVNAPAGTVDQAFAGYVYLPAGEVSISLTFDNKGRPFAANNSTGWSSIAIGLQDGSRAFPGPALGDGRFAFQGLQATLVSWNNLGALWDPSIPTTATNVTKVSATVVTNLSTAGWWRLVTLTEGWVNSAPYAGDFAVSASYNGMPTCASPDALEMACPCNPASGVVMSGTATKEDPVVTSYGNFYTSDTDLAVPTRGGGLSVSRSYNSLRGSDPLLPGEAVGKGWTPSFGERLSVDGGSGEVTVLQPGGAPAKFSPVVNSSPAIYTSSSWVTASLAKTAAGGFVLTYPDGRVDAFDPPVGGMSMLKSSTNRNGYVTSFTYSGKRVTQIKDVDSNRTINVAWNLAATPPNLTFTTDGTNPGGTSETLTAKWVFDTTSGDLVEVDDVGGSAHKFRYVNQAGYHLLDGLQGPRDGAFLVTNHYDSNNRVDTQTDTRKTAGESTRVTSFTYTGGSRTTPSTQTTIVARRDSATGAVLTKRVDFYDPVTARRTKAVEGDGSTQSVTHLYGYDSGTGALVSDQVQTGTDAAPAPVTVYRATVDRYGRPRSVSNGLLSGEPKRADKASAFYDYGTPGSLNDTLSLPVSVTDTAGVVTTFTYDAKGNVTSSCTPAVPSGSMPALGATAACSNAAADRKTTFVYDPNKPGDVVWVVDAAHNPAPPAAQNTCATGGACSSANASHLAYDATGNVVERSTMAVLQSNGQTVPSKTTWAYDNAGRLRSQVAPEGYQSGATIASYTTTFTPDAFGAWTTMSQPNPTGTPATLVTKRWFDNDHNLAKVQPADGSCPTVKCTTFDYDLRGLQTAVHRPVAGTDLVSTYTADGRLATQVSTQADGSSATTKYAWNTLGQLLSEEDPTGRATSYTYDVFGRLKTRTDPANSCGAGVSCTVGYQYDNASRLQGVTYSDGVTPNLGLFTYDNANRRTSVTAGSGASTVKTDFNWDSLGRMTSSSEAGETLSYVYNDVKTTTSSALSFQIQYPGGACPSTKCMTKTFDDAGRLVSVKDASGQTTNLKVDADGNYRSYTFPGGGVDTYGFDALDRMTSASFTAGSNTASMSYQRTPTGLVSNATETGLPIAAGEYSSGTQTKSFYGYDANERLCWRVTGGSTPTGTCAAPPTGSQVWSYDGSDAITARPGAVAKNDPAGQLCYSAPSGATTSGCAAPPAGATGYTNDARGNRTGVTPPGSVSQPSTLTYDSEHRLTQAAVPGLGSNAGEYTSLTPFRALDTRDANLCSAGVNCGKIPAGGSFSVQVTNKGGVPATGVGAVMFNLTVVASGVGNGNVSALPAQPGGAPGTSNINYNAGMVVSNGVVSKVDANGRVWVFNSGPGTVDAIVDVNGWFATASGGSGGTFTAVSPVRAFDTRGAALGGSCSGAAGNVCGAIPAGGSRTFSVVGAPYGVSTGVPLSNVASVTVNVTATGSSQAGSLTVWDGAGAAPTATANWFGANATVGELNVVKVSAAGTVTILNRGSAAVNVLVDVFGWTSADGVGGSDYVSLPAPTRTLDTSCSTNCPASLPACAGSPCGGVVVAGSPRVVTVAGKAGVPVGVTAVAVNVTAVGQSAAGQLSVYPGDLGSVPNVSNVNYAPGVPSGGGVIVKVPTSGPNAGQIKIASNAGAPNVLVDVTGYYVSALSTVGFGYDADGNRVAKVPGGAVAGPATTFVWDYAQGMALLAATKTNGVYTYYSYGPGGLVLSQGGTTAGSVTYLHHDQLGSTRWATSSANAVVGAWTFDPYGQITATAGNASATAMLYAGQYRDSETGLYNLRARIYDPVSGQFLTRDPLAAMTRDAYGYTGGNPLNATDPTGLFCIGGKNPNGSCRGSGAVKKAGEVAKEVGGRAVDVTMATVNAPVTAPTAAVNSWTGGDCDWAMSLTVVCYGGFLSKRSPGDAYVTGSTINTPLTKKEYRDANDGNLHRHETWHTRQWALFQGGPIFPALYYLETLRTGGDECQNVFEIWAGLEDGGYK
jgi:RHS repeat-associated protein